MDREHLQAILANERLELDTGTTMGDAMSGSVVVPVITSTGELAVAKVTDHDTEHSAGMARREYAVYTQLAPLLPVRVPELLHAYEGSGHTLLLLRRYERPKPPGAWSQTDWDAFTAVIAALHNASLPADPTPWVWTPWPGLDPDQDRAQIQNLWDDAAARRALLYVVEHRTDLEGLAAAVPPSLIHGDCHTGNIVHECSEPLLLDWQNAAIRSGTDDMAFLLLRAGVESRVPPPTKRVIRLYAHHRGLAEGVVLDAVRAAQLLVLAFHYPAFAAFLEERQSARLRAAFTALAFAQR